MEIYKKEMGIDAAYISFDDNQPMDASLLDEFQESAQ